MSIRNICIYIYIYIPENRMKVAPKNQTARAYSKIIPGSSIAIYPMLQVSNSEIVFLGWSASCYHTPACTSWIILLYCAHAVLSPMMITLVIINISPESWFLDIFGVFVAEVGLPSRKFWSFDSKHMCSPGAGTGTPTTPFWRANWPGVPRLPRFWKRGARGTGDPEVRKLRKFWRRSSTEKKKL